MNFSTKKTLEAANQASTEIVITDDKSLTRQDIRQIATVLAACPLVQNLVISGCDLSIARVNDLIPTILAHPSITKLDFSKNHIAAHADQYNLLKTIVTKAKKIHSVNLKDNTGRSMRLRDLALGTIGVIGTLGIGAIVIGESSWFRDVPRLLKNHDTLVDFKLNYTPYDHYFETPEHVPGHKNILAIGSDREGQNCTNNLQKAEALLTAVHEDGIKTYDEVAKLNQRLPAVLYLAEARGTRSETVQRLFAIKAALPVEYGITIAIEPLLTRADMIAAKVDYLPPTAKPATFLGLAVPKFLSLVPSESLPALLTPPAAIPQPLLELPDLKTTLAKITDQSDAEIRQQLEAARYHPQQLMSFGNSAVTAVGDIALASLQVTTATTSMETPVRSMAHFLEELEGAKQIVAGYAQRTDTKQRSRYLPPWGRGAPAGHLHKLADAGVKAQRAGKILQALLPTLENMEGDLNQQLLATHDIVGAYQVVGAQICRLRHVGNNVLQDWKAEAKTTIDIAPATQDLVGDRTPFHVRALTSRLSILEQMEGQVQSHVTGNMLQGSVDQKQQEGIAMLRGGNVPLLAEQVAIFNRQVNALQRASLISGVADATRTATGDAYSTTILAAMQTVQAIENIVGSTQEALINMGKSAEQISTHMVHGNRPPALSKADLALH